MSAEPKRTTFLPVSSLIIGEPETVRAKRALNGYNTVRYEDEKKTGIRRQNGAKKLKKLSGRHLAIVSMHLEGKRGEEIAKEMGVRVITVSRVLNDPMVKQLTSRIFSDRQMELDALAGKAIDVVRNGMEDGTTREKLAAVDRFTKLKDTIGAEESSAESAEDIVSRIFKEGVNAETVNVQVNVGDRNGR